MDQLLSYLVMETSWGAILDRNGLRPSRYYITKDHYLVLSSEVGSLDIPAKDIVLKRKTKTWKNVIS